ncbi:Dickkopf-related protein 3, partial [Varanus komodoensis]
ECIIDEDCETGKYCEFSGLEYKCHICKPPHKEIERERESSKLEVVAVGARLSQDGSASNGPGEKLEDQEGKKSGGTSFELEQHCSRDVECCGDQLCVWGECAKAASRGENGTICENQQDCNPGTCCAFSKDLLFPVCTPLPREQEPCHDPSNRFLNFITWELEPDGALDRCPCAHGLICQRQSHSSDSLCEPTFHKNQTGAKETPLLEDGISLLDFVAQDTPGDYEERLIKEVQKGLGEEVDDSKALDMASELFFGDEI